MLNDEVPAVDPAERRDRSARERMAASLARSLQEAEDAAIRAEHGHARELGAMEADRDAWRARAEAAERTLTELRGLRAVRRAEARRARRAR